MCGLKKSYGTLKSDGAKNPNSLQNLIHHCTIYTDLIHNIIWKYSSASFDSKWKLYDLPTIVLNFRYMISKTVFLFYQMYEDRLIRWTIALHCWRDKEPLASVITKWVIVKNVALCAIDENVHATAYLLLMLFVGE